MPSSLSNLKNICIMKPLYESIDRAASNKGQAASIKKHLAAVGINDWEDVTKSNLYALRDHLNDKMAPNTTKTILASLKAILHRYEDETELPKGWEGIVTAKGEKPQKTYLTVKEIEQFSKVEPRNDIERYVKACFLVSCWTGMRVSDAKRITPENIKDGTLSYVSEKTGILSVIPAKPGLWDQIRIIQEREGDMYLATYNDAVRRLARRAGINEKVKIHKAGRTLTVEKWEALSSHSGRVSIATCLADAGVSLIDTCRVLGHTSTVMTERYVVKTRPELSAKAMRFFA